MPKIGLHFSIANLFLLAINLSGVPTLFSDLPSRVARMTSLYNILLWTAPNTLLTLDQISTCIMKYGHFCPGVYERSKTEGIIEVR